MSGNVLYWINNDLRVHDNRALRRASEAAVELTCVFCIDAAWCAPNQAASNRLGEHRLQFLWESLECLDRNLENLGQRLVVTRGDPVTVLASIIERYRIDAVFRSNHVGVYENDQWARLAAKFPAVSFAQEETHTLFEQNQLSFGECLPDTFTRFRKLVEPVAVPPPVPPPNGLAPVLSIKNPAPAGPPARSNPAALFKGGEAEALQHLHSYLSSGAARHYKETRNELEGWRNSSKLSAWLANGSLAVRRVLQAIREHEASYGANDSTYGLYFELLWRE